MNAGPLVLHREVAEQLVSLARAGAPLEVCGLLGGNGSRAGSVYALTNAAGRSDYYTADPAEQFAAYRSMRDAGEECVAIYHSHPETPARPSAEDVEQANDPEPAYVIVSLASPAPDVRAFRIRDGLVNEITIEITED